MDCNTWQLGACRKNQTEIPLNNAIGAMEIRKNCYPRMRRMFILYGWHIKCEWTNLEDKLKTTFFPFSLSLCVFVLDLTMSVVGTILSLDGNMLCKNLADEYWRYNRCLHLAVLFHCEQWTSNIHHRYLTLTIWHYVYVSSLFMLKASYPFAQHIQDTFRPNWQAWIKFELILMAQWSNNEQNWQRNTDSTSTYKPKIREGRLTLQCVKCENSLNQMDGLLCWMLDR